MTAPMVKTNRERIGAALEAELRAQPVRPRVDRLWHGLLNADVGVAALGDGVPP